MGITNVTTTIQNIDKPKRKVSGEFMVDTGAVYTVIPYTMSKALELTVTKTQKFSLADGTTVERDLSYAMIEIDGERAPSTVVIGKRGDSALIGAVTLEGMGFVVAMKTLDNSRGGVGAQGVGVAQGAFDEAVKFAKQRVQFGHPIISFQAVQHMLADMATDIEAARALVYSVARFIDSGAKEITKESAMAKVFATDVGMRVTTNAVQVMGGSGYMREYPVEKMMRDAKILQIYEGTNQIQRNVIGQALMKKQK